MKKLVFAIALFIGASAFTVLNDGSKDLVGKWKFDEASYPAARKVIIERVRKQSPEQAEQIEAMGEQLDQLLVTLTFEYKGNGEYEFATPQGPQGGKWTITNDGKYLERQSNNGGPTRKDSIIEIKADRIKLFDLDAKEKLEYIKAD